MPGRRPAAGRALRRRPRRVQPPGRSSAPPRRRPARRPGAPAPRRPGPEPPSPGPPPAAAAADRTPTGPPRQRLRRAVPRDVAAPHLAPLDPASRVAALVRPDHRSAFVAKTLQTVSRVRMAVPLVPCVPCHGSRSCPLPQRAPPTGSSGTCTARQMDNGTEPQESKSELHPPPPARGAARIAASARIRPNLPAMGEPGAMQHERGSAIRDAPSARLCLGA